jgi:hypothetical protein
MEWLAGLQVSLKLGVDRVARSLSDALTELDYLPSSQLAKHDQMRLPESAGDALVHDEAADWHGRDVAVGGAGPGEGEADVDVR